MKQKEYNYTRYFYKRTMENLEEIINGFFNSMNMDDDLQWKIIHISNIFDAYISIKEDQRVKVFGILIFYKVIEEVE